MKTIYLERVSCDIPWGFRMVGGKDYGQPIVVHKVSGGSIASGNLLPGDVLVQVMGLETENMTHVEAMQAIKSAGTTLQLSLIRTDDEEQPPSDYPESIQPQEYHPQDSFHSSYSPSQPFSNPQDVYTTPQVPYNTPQDAYTPPQHVYISPQELYAQQDPATNFDFAPVSEALEESVDQSSAFSEPPPPPGIYPEHGPFSNHYDDNNNTDDYNNNNNNNNGYNDHQAAKPATLKSPTSPPIDIFAKSSVKPFTYVTDIHDIQAQREKIRKKGLNKKVLPAYQNLDNINPHHGETPPEAAPNSALVENLQFNSPLQLYSPDNVVDSLKMQTGAEVDGVLGLEEKKPLDVKQSEVYKMIHGLSPDRPRNVPAFSAQKGPPQKDDDTSGVDRSSIYKMSKFEKGNSRIRGVQSKSFRMLQSMTGAPDDYEPHQRHSRQKAEQPAEAGAESTDF